MVYDCGSETGTKAMGMPLDQQIDAFTSNIPQIDLLFISHFHSDHISGLSHLLSNTKVVKTVIPMLDLATITVTRIQNFLNNNQTTAQGVDNIIRDLYLDGENKERFGEIVKVVPETEEEHEGNDVNMLPINGRRMFSGSSLTYNAIWEYVPFNSIDKTDQRAKKLLKKLEALSSGSLDLNALIKNKLVDVRNVYKEVMNKQDDNLYTLVVTSKPVSGIVPKPCPRLAHCVYFGDFDHKQKSKPWIRLNKIIKYAEMGTVQVPHHGAKGNWLPAMGEGDPRHYIISSGSTNNHHHPNYWVIQNIWDAGHRPFVVCERFRSAMKYCFQVQ